MKKKIELEFLVGKKIAEILAAQYYSGWINKKKCDMTFKKYKSKSLLNWFPAACGIMNLVRHSSKFKKILK